MAFNAAPGREWRLDKYSRTFYYTIMSVMNPEASFGEFMTLAEQDTGVFAILQATKSIANWWLGAILIIFLSIPLLVLAQVVPFYFRRHLAKILPVLPYIKDRESLSWLKDAFSLYSYTLKGYRRFSLFRKSVNSLMDDLDEQIDSLRYVLENQQSLRSAVERIEHPPE